MLSATFTIALLIGGTALVVQFLLMLLGLGEGDELSVGDDPGVPGDADLGDGGGHWFYEMLSLRTLSAALAFFGLSGKTMLAYGIAELPTFVISSVVGVAAMYIVYWLFKQLYRLQHAGNENVGNAVGLPATVYVPIPAGQNGAGKVTFRLQDRLVEYQAVTDEAERLATGEKVVIVGVVNSETVCVARDAAAMHTAEAPNPNLASSASS